MFDPGFVCPPDAIERITQAEQALDAGFVGDQTPHASAHGLAADHKFLRAALSDHAAPGVQQHRLTVGRLARAAV